MKPTGNVFAGEVSRHPSQVQSVVIALSIEVGSSSIDKQKEEIFHSIIYAFLRNLPMRDAAAGTRPVTIVSKNWRYLNNLLIIIPTGDFNTEPCLIALRDAFAEGEGISQAEASMVLDVYRDDVRDLANRMMTTKPVP